jgi:hypothetical protein
LSLRSLIQFYSSDRGLTRKQPKVPTQNNTFLTFIDCSLLYCLVANVLLFGHGDSGFRSRQFDHGCWVRSVSSFRVRFDSKKLKYFVAFRCWPVLLRHKQNRVPMVCSGKYGVLTPLAKCLTQPRRGSRDGRHIAKCLTQRGSRDGRHLACGSHHSRQRLTSSAVLFDRI